MRKYVKTSPVVKASTFLGTQSFQEYLDLISRTITDLEARVATLETEMNAAESDIAALDARVTALEP